MKGVLLDTSFFIRLLYEEDPLHLNAMGYYKHFLSTEVDLFISTISIAEYCVKGSFDDLPFKDVRVIPFNISHAKEAGRLASIVFDERKSSPELNLERLVIPNDTKLFAQTQSEKGVDIFLTSDTKCKAVFELLERNTDLDFKIMDLKEPISYFLGQLDFDS